MKKQLQTLRFFITFLCLSLFISLEAQSKNTDYFGSWTYSVKVNNASIFNPEVIMREANPQFFPKKANKSTKKFYSGNQQMKGEDVFYTGYFKLSPKAELSNEIIGSYFPFKHSNPYNYAPIKIYKVKQLDKNTKEIYWYADFKLKNIDPELTFWMAKGIYKEGSNTMQGLTAALDCRYEKGCSIINIVKWEAKRVSDISYFSEKNYKWKPLFSSLLRLVDFNGLIEKYFLKDKDQTDQDLNNYVLANSSDDYFKPSIKAMLPVKAGAMEPDVALKVICNPSFCSETARWWKPVSDPALQSKCSSFTGGKQQECLRQQECERATTGRRSLCCNSMASGGGEMRASDGKAVCDCTPTTKAAESATCCRPFATCQEEKTTPNPDGSLNTTKTNTTYSPDTINANQSRQMVTIDPYFAQQMGQSPQGALGYNPNSGVNFFFHKILPGTNYPLPLCTSGLPCKGIQIFDGV